MRGQLLALADRCEAARDADRELDAEIAVTVVGGEIVWLTANYTMEQYPARKYQSRDHVGGFGKEPIPAYTASLDAAMTLVPKGADWGVSSEPPIHGARYHAAVNVDGLGARVSSEYYATPALALTAAALRARAAQVEG